MTNSRNIAGLLGPSALAVALSEAINFHVLASAPSSFVYMNGCILFVAGLAIIRAHSCWKWGWQVIITIVGWALVLLGAIRMFAPELASKGAHQNPAGVYISIGLLLLAGIVMTVKGYSREGK